MKDLRIVNHTSLTPVGIIYITRVALSCDIGHQKIFPKHLFHPKRNLELTTYRKLFLFHHSGKSVLFTLLISVSPSFRVPRRPPVTNPVIFIQSQPTTSWNFLVDSPKSKWLVPELPHIFFTPLYYLSFRLDPTLCPLLSNLFDFHFCELLIPISKSPFYNIGVLY